MMHFTPAPRPRLQGEPFFAGSEGEFHKTLARFNQERFTPANPGIVLFEPGNALRFHRMEVAFLEAMRQEAQTYLSENPADPEDLVAWFESVASGAGEQAAAFFDWLAERADSEQVRWVLQQEIGAEAAVPDLLALSQVRMPARVKVAMARAFWEEMGRGEEKATHSEMLEHLAHHFAIRADLGAIIPEAMAQENLLNAMGAHRQYAFHAAGALGITALLNDERAPTMMRALTRLKVPAKARKVFAVQAARDPAETRAWLDDVIAPLARRNTVRAQSLAEGAVMRLMAAARCQEAYRLKFASELQARRT